MMKLFSGSANQPLAENIAKALGTSLSPRELFIFPDGERRVWIETEVLEEDCVIVQPTTPPVDEQYMELFFLIDGLKRSGAKSITVVMPYLGYQRQDHIFRSGEAVSVEVVIKLLESLHVDKVIACDLHTIKIPELFTISLVHLSALPLFANVIKENNWTNEDTVLVTPDMGGIRRIKIISELLGNMPYVTVEKNRDLATGVSEASSFDGEIKKRALIVDDMMSSGHSMVNAANLLLENGAEEVIAFASHAIFSPEAPNLLQESRISKVYVTDSVYIPEEKKFEKLTILSLAEDIAKELQVKS